VFEADADLEQLLIDHTSGHTLLLAFFDFCAAHPAVTSDITYADAPKILTYSQGSGAARSKWKIRQKGETLRRMYFASRQKVSVTIFANAATCGQVAEELWIFEKVWARLAWREAC
jgi:hypothetical protein